MKREDVLRCVLVDPSLFTGPYDAALTGGLAAVHVHPLWVTRPTRRGDDQEIPTQYAAPIFYTRTDTAGVPAPLRPVLKGVAHAFGLARLIALIARYRPDVVHVQWTVVPLLDAVAIWLLRRRYPVLLTVHDPVPFNGQRLPLLQRLGFDLPIRLAHRVIVHTRSGQRTLVARGIDPAKIAVVAHGVLPLRARPRRQTPRDTRWTFVLFGELKPYKGLDLLVEALALLRPEVRQQARVIVAGRARMPLADIEARIAALALEDAIELRPERLSEQAMADLFACTDCFVFPYREIDASGVYFLVKGLGKWLIASRVGIFAEDLREAAAGTLVPSGDVHALAAALEHAILERPAHQPTAATDSWLEIARSTRALYEEVLQERAGQPCLSRTGDADA